MKYIRALDDIWEYNQKDNIAIRPSRCPEKCEQMWLRVKKDYIEKQADTIEELCDLLLIPKSEVCMRITHTTAKATVDYYFENEKWNKKYSLFMGAIWTDKGLIYVAKMNSKGELELL